MTNKDIKMLAMDFRRKYNIDHVNIYNLRAAIEKQGYTIVEYNNIVNDDSVNELMDSLNLWDIAKRTRGFVYARGEYRIVFINEDLSEEEKILVLAHEAGHIYCGHFSSSPIIGNDVQEEYEANEFTHYILNQNSISKISNFFRSHTRVILCTIVIILLAVVIFKVVSVQKRYYGEYYITDTGEKYHEKNCIFVKNKTNVSRITVEEFESGEYEPCKTCLP